MVSPFTTDCTAPPLALTAIKTSPAVKFPSGTGSSTGASGAITVMLSDPKLATNIVPFGPTVTSRARLADIPAGRPTSSFTLTANIPSASTWPVIGFVNDSMVVPSALRFANSRTLSPPNCVATIKPSSKPSWIMSIPWLELPGPKLPISRLSAVPRSSALPLSARRASTASVSPASIRSCSVSSSPTANLEGSMRKPSAISTPFGIWSSGLMVTRGFPSESKDVISVPGTARCGAAWPNDPPSSTRKIGPSWPEIPFSSMPLIGLPSPSTGGRPPKAPSATLSEEIN